MKKLIAILLLSVYMASATELHQLLKVPALVAHFIEHRQQDEKLSFWNFLCKHYAHGNIKDADYEKDMKLPFKSHQDCPNPTVFVSLLPVSNLFHLQDVRQIYGEPRLFSVRDESFINTAFLSAVWQPPKVA